MNKIISHSFFLCALFLTGVIGNINQKPVNVATSVGGQNFFNCSSDFDANAILWLYTIDCNFANGVSLTVSNCELNNSYASHYRTEKPDGSSCNLVVFNASLSLGGCYECSDGRGIGRQYSAFLVIVDTNATVTSNSTDLIPGEDVMISTSVSYRGPSIPLLSPPSFYWTLQSDPSHNITSYQGSTTNTSASSNIVVTAQKPLVPPYVCNLFFNPPVFPPQQSWATNAPTYRTSWETLSYNVFYPPENMNISETNAECPHDVAVVLTCSASGYPIPTYKWLDLTNGGGPYEGSTANVDRGGIYECVASNTFRDVTHPESMYANVSDCFTYVVDDNQARTCDTLCIVGLAIAIFFGLNLLFFVIFMICYGCSKSGRNKLNDRFPWLEKMLPCMNDKGCECSVWIFYFTILSIFVALVFFPVILIMASCCPKKKKTSQGSRQENERNGRGAGSTQLNTLGTGTTPYQYPARVSVTSNPPSSLNTSANFQQDQTDRSYRPSSTQQHQPTYWGNSDPYPPNPRNLQMPRQTPSPALSSGGVVYADLRVDNQPKSRRPIQPIQNDANTYADIAMA